MSINIRNAERYEHKGQPGGYCELDTSGKIPQSRIPSGSITSSHLVTATGQASGGVGQGGMVYIALNDFSFFPNFQGGTYPPSASTEKYHAGPNLSIGNVAGAPSGTVGYVCISAVEGYLGNPYSYTVRWRYITASEKAVIAIAVDEHGNEHYWCSEPIRVGDKIVKPIIPEKESSFEMYQTEKYNYDGAHHIIREFKEGILNIKKIKAVDPRELKEF